MKHEITRTYEAPLLSTGTLHRAMLQVKASHGRQCRGAREQRGQLHLRQDPRRAEG